MVADLRGMAVADLAQATTANACAALPGLQKLLHQNGLWRLSIKRYCY